MNRLSALFEEDIDMQDSLDDIETLVDDSEDIVLTALESRAQKEEDNKEISHLFDSEPIETDEDELTQDEETAVNIALLDGDIEDDIDDADLDDEIIDAAIGEDVVDD